MFKNLFAQKSDKSDTGFYKIEGNKLIAIDQVPGNGSINSVIEYLGYPANHIYTITTFNSKKVNSIGFMTLSKEPVFVLAKTKETALSFPDISAEILSIDWNFYYSSLNVEEILTEGITLENFNSSFLKSVIDLIPDGENIYKSNKLGLYFLFENDLLKAFTSTGWTSSSTKWLESLNKPMVRQMTEEAKLYQDNEIDILEEVNRQTNSILNIPDAVNNKFINLHKTRNGNVNFYNLLLAHYTQDCDLTEFLFVNKGRYKQLDNSTYEVGNFIYEFNTENKLDKVFDK